MAIMEHGSTPYVGLTRKNIAAIYVLVQIRFHPKIIAI